MKNAKKKTAAIIALCSLLGITYSSYGQQSHSDPNADIALDIVRPPDTVGIPPLQKEELSEDGISIYPNLATEFISVDLRARRRPHYPPNI
ncbi:MAG: hypothetical protein U5L96_13235 [Owenweeksia sp.]|nr:hypothetical protein [Owenweeksia sp.]